MTQSPFLTPVDLKTARGEFVQTVKIPKFVSSPDILIWGLRVFQRYDDSDYREVFYFAIPPSFVVTPD